MSNYISVNKEKCYLMREFCDTVFALNKGETGAGMCAEQH